MATTLTGTENALEGVYFSVLGGTFKLKKTTVDGYTFHDVVNDDGQVIGSAHRIYSDGWAVHTKPYAGYVPDSQIVMVD